VNEFESLGVLLLLLFLNSNSILSIYFYLRFVFLLSIANSREQASAVLCGCAI
jgi:hypothetical protein